MPYYNDNFQFEDEEQPDVEVPGVSIGVDDQAGDYGGGDPYIWGEDPSQPPPDKEGPVLEDDDEVEAPAPKTDPLGGWDATEITRNYLKAAQQDPTPNLTPSMPGGSGGRGEQITSQFAQDWMKTPSRYDSDLVQRAMEAVEAQMARTRRDQMNQFEGYLGSKGILSSTPGAELWQEQYNRLGEQENREHLDILMDQARTYSQDMSAAGGLGLGVDTLSQRAFEWNREEQLRMRALDLQRYGIDQQTAVAMAGLDLRAKEIGINAALEERRLDLISKGMDADEAWRQANFEWDKSQDLIKNRQWDESHQWDKDSFQQGMDWDQKKWDDQVAQWAKEHGWKQDESKRYWDWMWANKGQAPPGYDDGGGGGAGGGGGGTGYNPGLADDYDDEEF